MLLIWYGAQAAGAATATVSYGDPRELRSRNPSLSPKSLLFKSRNTPFSSKDRQGGRH